MHAGQANNVLPVMRSEGWQRRYRMRHNTSMFYQFRYKELDDVPSAVSRRDNYVITSQQRPKKRPLQPVGAWSMSDQQQTYARTTLVADVEEKRSQRNSKIVGTEKIEP